MSIKIRDLKKFIPFILSAIFASIPFNSGNKQYNNNDIKYDYNENVSNSNRLLNITYIMCCR